MSQDKSSPIGSPDSGVEDALAASINKLLLDNPDNDKDSSEEKEADEVIESGKPSNGKKVVIIQTHPHQYRGTSVSSDETMPSPGEDRDVTGPKTKEERLDLLRDLLETYFSDNYLTRDIFLLKHFRKSKEGWISLKFMASYKKIKRTAKNRAEVEEAIRMSPLLEMNEDESKVRRLAPFPACIEDYIPTRMCLTGALSREMRNLVTLSNFLSTYGEVASLQVLRPGVNVPESLMSTANNFPQMRDQWCALVEFDEIEAAGKLASDVNNRKIDKGLTWAMELVMPWKNRKNSERQEKTLWTESVKNRCRSCPSSGYSSPCLTPEQSPLGCPGRHNEYRGMSKRERIMMTRGCQGNCCQHTHFPSTCGTCCCKKTHNHRVHRKSENGTPHKSPKRTTSHMNAETCENWRTAPMIH
ncbi:la-related protein 6-like [Macrobrachium nipponense]|uniref:la-related protein 6-like n=1 Tax=Macrobrachium nipponense TaxID=159736 RepID=UPI0030C87931